MWKTIKYPTLCHSPLCYEWGVLKCWVVLNSQILENGPGKRKSVSSERIPNPKKESKVSRFVPNMVQQSRIISIHNLVAIHIAQDKKILTLPRPPKVRSETSLWMFWAVKALRILRIWPEELPVNMRLAVPLIFRLSTLNWYRSLPYDSATTVSADDWDDAYVVVLVF